MVYSHIVLRDVLHELLTRYDSSVLNDGRRAISASSPPVTVPVQLIGTPRFLTSNIITFTGSQVLSVDKHTCDSDVFSGVAERTRAILSSAPSVDPFFLGQTHGQLTLDPLHGSSY